MYTKNRLLGICALLAAMMMFSGCYSAYKAAMDERSIGVLADDKKLATAIKYDLMHDDSVKGLDISVAVYFGDVYLVGAVEDPKQKTIAVAIAKSREGAGKVTSYILNKNDKTLGKSVDDAAIAAKAKAKMIKDKEMKSTQIKVKSVLGHVVLMGIVDSQADKAKAIAYAKQVENVKKVKSYIKVLGE